MLTVYKVYVSRITNGVNMDTTDTEIGCYSTEGKALAKAKEVGKAKHLDVYIGRESKEYEDEYDYFKIETNEAETPYEGVIIEPVNVK